MNSYPSSGQPGPLTDDELAALVRRVFQPGPGDQALAILADLPDAALTDHPGWRARRQLAFDWTRGLAGQAASLGLETRLFWYRNVRTNNADLPATAWLQRDGPLPASADELPESEARPLETILTSHQLVMAPTELSATAPLKLLSRRLGCRAATLPGFGPAMIPALRLDFGEIQRRVERLKELLDAAEAAVCHFRVGDEDHRLLLDLRYRQGHASGGLLRTPGTAGNLPSGEAYIVPYEGERRGEPSRSQGVLPVEIEGEVVRYRIEENRAVEVERGGPVARRESEALLREPAYGNLAELGLGVLAELGIEPIGEILLDEKLGPHIAFGRSDHFGGQVGAADFSRPEAVIHLDRVYLPATQPQVDLRKLTLRPPSGAEQVLLRDGHYAISW